MELRRLNPTLKILYLMQNENLERIRNLHLPRLISSKLSVENPDIQFPPSMVEEAEAVALIAL